MNSIKVIAAEFQKSMVTPEEPLANLPEIAIIGRSNAGKSTLINRLANQKKLARVSSTPGRTQQLNSFLFTLKSDSETIALQLIDLPGFGYARLSHVEREKLQLLIKAYLTKAKPADLVLLLNDSKRLPQAEEINVRNYCFERDINILIVLTKTDRLNRKEMSEQVKKISSAYGLEAEDLLITGNKISVDRIWQRVLGLA